MTCISPNRTATGQLLYCPPGSWIIGTSSPGRELAGQASILSFARQLERQVKEMQLGASSLLCSCREQARMLKR
eukprot:364397-Chlamydomonas_euryale.AAC.18